MAQSSDQEHAYASNPFNVILGYSSFLLPMNITNSQKTTAPKKSIGGENATYLHVMRDETILLMLFATIKSIDCITQIHQTSLNRTSNSETNDDKFEHYQRGLLSRGHGG
jgi:hypothetical protein